jgi:hypothetical protein
VLKSRTKRAEPSGARLLQAPTRGRLYLRRSFKSEANSERVCPILTRHCGGECKVEEMQRLLYRVRCGEHKFVRQTFTENDKLHRCIASYPWIWPAIPVLITGSAEIKRELDHASYNRNTP